MCTQLKKDFTGPSKVVFRLPTTLSDIPAFIIIVRHHKVYALIDHLPLPWVKAQWSPTVHREASSPAHWSHSRFTHVCLALYALLTRLTPPILALTNLSGTQSFGTLGIIVLVYTSSSSFLFGTLGFAVLAYTSHTIFWDLNLAVTVHTSHSSFHKTLWHHLHLLPKE